MVKKNQDGAFDGAKLDSFLYVCHRVFIGSSHHLDCFDYTDTLAGESG